MTYQPSEKAVTPQQRAAEHLFGDPEFKTFDGDHEFCDPFNQPHRVSFNQLVARYSVQSAADIADAMQGTAI